MYYFLFSDFHRSVFLACKPCHHDIPLSLSKRDCHRKKGKLPRYWYRTDTLLWADNLVIVWFSTHQDWFSFSCWGFPVPVKLHALKNFSKWLAIRCDQHWSTECFSVLALNVPGVYRSNLPDVTENEVSAHWKKQDFFIFARLYDVLELTSRLIFV